MLGGSGGEEATISENGDENAGVVLVNDACIMKQRHWQVDGNIGVLQQYKTQ